MLSQKAQVELDKKVVQAREIMAAIMAAGDLGSVTIGYGNGGLRIEYSRLERPVPVQAEPVLRPQGSRAK